MFIMNDIVINIECSWNIWHSWDRTRLYDLCLVSHMYVEMWNSAWNNLTFGLKGSNFGGGNYVYYMNYEVIN